MKVIRNKIMELLRGKKQQFTPAERANCSSGQHSLKLTDLCDALLLLETREEAINFMKDICTPQEIAALSERWIVCQMLQIKKISYREIKANTGVSVTTIGRVARFLRDEPYGGYRKILGKLNIKSEK
ncbi:MAG: hypothetical protein LBT64_03145 [Puniceicoccales bacterium]|jgi:TrpR-related protein YerC/YecD|nr:hypothetical protein [Puniceicoccales bacterium]